MVLLLANKGVVGVREVEAFIGVDTIIRQRTTWLVIGVNKHSKTCFNYILQLFEIAVKKRVP